ncbi:hypothetical protein CRUP_034092 [Coryphaenoides rupestris]|nr:hypothetical protein CRUP_034092 [Coryphaenoides rupestris]
MANCGCGLLSVNKEPVPLKSVDVEVTVQDHVATVASILLYENREQSPIEAVFVFPLPSDAAVCHFSAKIGQLEVVAEVREKQKAREEYDDALSSGQQAFLLEEMRAEAPTCSTLSVGSLPPGESASIRLEYVIELAVQADDGLRFCLPAVLNPRYQPQGSDDSSSGDLTSGPGTTVPASQVTYSLSLSASVWSPRPITKIESNCSLDPVQYLDQQQTQATVKLASGHKFNCDVELLLYYKDSHLPTAVVEAGLESAKSGSLMADPVVMLSLYPEFPGAGMSSTSKSGEFLFGTLLLLMKSLPVGCYFNIYSFGSEYTHVFPKSVVYNQKTMDEALKLFVFTDGEVCNTKDVIKVVKKNSGSHSSGQQAFLLEESEQSPDVFTLSVGSLPPGESASIRLEYVIELAVQADDGLRFCLPAVLNPRYQPQGSDDSSSGDLTSGPGTTVPASQVTYSLSLSASVWSPRPITKIESNCSLDPVQYLDQQQTQATVKLASGHKFNCDVELLLYYKDSHLPTAVVEAGLESAKSGSLMADPVVMLSLYPEFPGAGMSSTSKSGEFLFLFVFTDGEVCNTKDVIKVVKKNSGSHRCFSFGIGDGASTALINGLAKEGSGHAQFITGADRMQSKVPTGVSVIPLSPPITNLFQGQRLTAHRLGARALIRTLELEANCSKPDNKAKAKEKKVVEVSVQSGVSSSLTAFIAVNKGSGEALQGPLLRRNVPAPTSSVWASLVAKDPMVQLVRSQRASGSWLLETALATVLGKTLAVVTDAKPALASPEVWATVLALIWLHGFKMDTQDEWEFLAMKAVSWLQGEEVACMAECVALGNVLLGCQVPGSSVGM